MNADVRPAGARSARPITFHWKLAVYQLAMAAAAVMFKTSKTFPSEEKFSLASQMCDSSRSVTAQIALGPLSGDDVRVELIHGTVGLNDELEMPQTEVMAAGADGQYSASWTCERAGRYGFTVRVVPSHPHLASWPEVGTITWA